MGGIYLFICSFFSFLWLEPLISFSLISLPQFVTLVCLIVFMLAFGCRCHHFLVSGFRYAWLDFSDFGLIRDCLGEFLHKPLLEEKKEEKLNLVFP